jgi:hypothetical protein
MGEHECHVRNGLHTRGHTGMEHGERVAGEDVIVWQGTRTLSRFRR